MALYQTLKDNAMANDIVAGLFGLSPFDVQQRQNEANRQYAASLAQADPFVAAKMSLGQAGAGLGQIGAGMMGLVNPEVEAAKQREAVMAQGGLDMSSAWLNAKAEQFRQAGDLQTAMRFKMAAQAQLEKEQERELKSTEMAKNLAQAQKAMREEDAAKQPTSVAEYQYAVTNGYKGTFQEWLKDKAQSTHISVGGGESKQPLPYIDPSTGKAVWGTIAEARGKPAAAYDPVTKQIVASAVAEGTVKGKDAAMIGGKYDALDAISSAQGLLEKGIYTGGYAAAGKAIAKYTPGMDKTKVANTEEFLSHIGNVVIPRLQEFGGNDSVEELKYLRAVSAGDITLEEEAIKKILSAAERKINAGIRRVAKGQQQTSGDGLSIEDRLKKYPK